MTIPTQTSLAGFIASTLTAPLHPQPASARFYARVGVEHARKEPDGHVHGARPHLPRPRDLPSQRRTCLRPIPQRRLIRRGGYIHDYQVDHNGETVEREEFVARRIGHDTTRTRYDVQRRQPDLREPAASTVTPDAVGM